MALHSRLQALASCSSSSILAGWVPSTNLGATLVDYFDKYVPGYPRYSLDEIVSGTLKHVHESSEKDHTKFIDWQTGVLPW